MKINSWLGPNVAYKSLGNKEQESYNTAKLISVMAEYGYLECAKINGDKWGADLLFYRSTDSDVKKVQLKGRATFGKNYMGKDLHVAFKGTDGWYLYPHDQLVEKASSFSSWQNTLSWSKADGGYSWNSPPAWLKSILKEWKIS